MKVYLYHSKKTIDHFNNPLYVKKQIASLLTELLNKFSEVDFQDIIIGPASISNNIDLFLVIDDSIPEEMNSKIVNIMNEIKNRVLEIITKDQGVELSYNIKAKIEEGHTPVNSSLKNSKDKDKSIDMSINPEFDYEQRSLSFIPKDPVYSFDRVFLPVEVIDKIEEALATLQCEKKVFGDWGLYEIQPYPASSLNFFGPPGTGKSMAAEAIAKKLGKKILRVTYADVESKYHGEGPKMVKAIFLAAQRENAVLFFDEADSLLSKRLTNTNDGTAQAINSMRSQLTTCLDSFRGIVIFATNLIVNYDQAFLTRLISVEFKHPDIETRKRIWDGHIKASEDCVNSKINIPLSEDVNTQALSEKYDFVGREIRNAVISACIRVAMENRDVVTQADFEKSCERIIAEQQSISNANDHTLNKSAKEAIVKEMIKVAKEKEVQNVSKSPE